jgi:RNA polymerase sigma-70 factor (ECF subfamily)
MQATASLGSRAHATAQPISENNPDAHLIERIRSRDQSALAEAYEQHGDAVFAAAFAVTRRRELAEETTQEVFVRLWNRPGRFDPDRGSLRAFVKIDARGRAIDALRAERARRDREDKEARLAASAPVAGVEERVMATITSDQIRHALSALKEEQRIPLALAYFEGRSYREVATLLDLPEGTVKSRIRVGLRRMKGALQTVGIEAT